MSSLRNLRVLGCGAVWCLVLSACDRDPPGPAAAASAPAPTPSASTSQPDPGWLKEVAQLKRAIAASLKSRQPRVAAAKFLGFAGAGQAKQAKFLISNRSPKAIEWAQAWVYYYDAGGRYLDRYPDTFEATWPPQGTTKQKLGYRGAKLPDEAATADCEISAVEWDDGSQWSNENLEQTEERRPGGPSEAELTQREGEVVVGKWTDHYGQSKRPLFWLTNISGRPLQTQTLWTFYYSQDKELLDRERDRQTVKLGAGVTVQVETGDPKDEIEPGTRFVEIAVSGAQFLDGAREKWINENLSQASRPMRPARQ